MTAGSPQSWGRYPRHHQETVQCHWRSDALPLRGVAGKTCLPFGNGRSYGDVCLNDGGVLLGTRGLNRFMEFNARAGTLRCESGVLLSDILDFALPRGWFLPVTPGTQFVTIGGAIANDVHGKNHHRLGTFGCHVSCFELLRSDGARLICSPEKNAEWFRATIGGLGLTGMITWAEITLKPVTSGFIDREILRFQNLRGFFALAEESDERFDYTVAWVDCLAKGSSLGRGLFIRGNHAEGGLEPAPAKRGGSLGVPFTPPLSLVNRLSLRPFNFLYYRKPLPRKTPQRVPARPFFYPLDAIRNWNRVYGPRGFLQYQCVLPPPRSRESLEEILGRISAAGRGSFLAVLKQFGNVESPGLLSFPRPGITLALDFPNGGSRTLDLLDSLDEVTRSSGGAVNPSKDARMSAVSFQSFFPRWADLKPFIDPAFSSSFWRRVTATNSRPEVSGK